MTILPKKILIFLRYLRNTCLDGYALKSYSQEGEDMILNSIFGQQESGFYVDVGAFHPKRFSNTYFFYKKGWKGLNIDAMPGSMELFNKLRPRDINIEKAISDKKETLTYYIFNEPAVNGFSEKISKKRQEKGNYYIVSNKQIEMCTLKEVLDTYLPKGQLIDFLSIDVEGLDAQVLKSNDWQKYIPKVILVEILDQALEDIFNSEIYLLLKSKGYSLFAKSVNTFFFKI